MAQAHHSLTRGVVVAAAAVLLSGCPSPAPRPALPSPPAVSPPVPSPPAANGPSRANGSAPGVPSSPGAPAPRPPPPVRENHLSPATRALVAQSHSLAAHGDLDGASSTLDRALRIEPNNPLLWIERGRLRLVDGDVHQAESCGRKALVLASGDQRTLAQAGRLIADALRAQGRNQEAQAVESQPFMH